MKQYAPSDINRFREYIGEASEYVRDAGDRQLEENLDEVLDYLVLVLDTIDTRMEGKENG